MPLRAVKNGEMIQAYNFSEEEWDVLKEKRKKFKLIMPCCQNKAIPKRSKLGTQFFAHSKRGDCISKAESKEHLLAKSIIARVCQERGWQVTTEYRGQTTNNEVWIADIYAEKNSIKIIFEVQWSPQTEEVTRKRQERYKQAGIRSAWLVKERKRNLYNTIEEYQIPYFEMRYNEDTNNFIIPRYNVTLEKFIKGMLNKELTWFPPKKMNVDTGLIIIEDYCWKCGKKISLVSGLLSINKKKNFEHFYKFNEVSATIASILTPNLKKKYHIGEIKQRYSKTVQNKYLSNGCYYCDAIYGDFFLKEETLEFLVTESYPEPIIITKHQLGKEIPLPSQAWYFQGRKGKY